MRPSEAGGFGLVDGGGVEFAVGGVYDGFVAALVEREVVDFLAAQSVRISNIICIQMRTASLYFSNRPDRLNPFFRRHRS